MNKWLSLSWMFLFVALFATDTSAQKKKGKEVKEITNGYIHYEMTMEGGGMMGGMGESTMEMYFKGERSKAVINMMGGMMSTTTIMDNEAKEGLMLMSIPMMGQNMAVRLTEEDMAEYEDMQRQNASPPKIVVDKKSKKKIAKYKCYKATAEVEGIDEPAILYICDKFKPQGSSQWSIQYPGLEGFPLAIEVNQAGVGVKFTATEVNFDEPNESEFSMDVPSGYEEMTFEEFQQMQEEGGAFGM